MRVLSIKRMFYRTGHRKGILDKSQVISENLKLQHFQKLRFCILLHRQHNDYQMQKLEALRKLAVYKVNSMVFKLVLRRKERYMAAKFKAMSLCRLGFQALLSNCSKSRLEQSKKLRMHEHISTSYSSI